MRASALISKAMLLVVVFLAGWIQPGSALANPTLRVLHSFTGIDGAAPGGSLILKSGALYGTTESGGATATGGSAGYGTVFKLARETGSGIWAESVLHNFKALDGGSPEASLIFDKSGALFGTGLYPSVDDYGGVFKLTPPATTTGAWTERLLHAFTSADNAGEPYSALIFDSSGALYGTTLGAFEGTGGGTVFKLTPPATTHARWTLTVLHVFTGIDGFGPYSGVIFDKSGALYGTTQSGGAVSTSCPHGCGTVFKLTPPATTGGAWTESVLHSFAKIDGYFPDGGLIFDKSGALYGTTVRGGAHDLGTVFELAPPAGNSNVWTESVLHSFAGSDGETPVAGLIFDGSGALYGTTNSGGADDDGTVFKLTPPATKSGAWVESVLHSFMGADGEGPDAGLIFDKFAALYGTTIYGGADGYGTVFKLTVGR